MDIQARKIELIQEFLKLQSEEAISRLENFFKLEKELDFKPMTIEELNNRVNLSEADFDAGNVISNDDILKKYAE